RHTRFSRDWSSDVCSSDLVIRPRSIWSPRAFTFILPTATDFSLSRLSESISIVRPRYVVCLLILFLLFFFDICVLLPKTDYLKYSEERRVGNECSCWVVAS